MVGTSNSSTATMSTGHTAQSNLIEEGDNGLISENCCYLASCIDLCESDLRSSLFCFLGVRDDDRRDAGEGKKGKDRKGDKNADYKGKERKGSSHGNKHRSRNKGSQGCHNSSRSNDLARVRKGQQPNKMAKVSSQKIKIYQHRPIRYSYSSNSHKRNQPPPVIALSRSSFSSNSDTSASSSLATTEFESSFPRVVSPDRRRKDASCPHERSGCSGDTSEDDMDAVGLFSSLGSSGSDTERNYRALHEYLINSLFEDAKRRQEQELLQQSEVATEPQHSPSENHQSFQTPPRGSKASSHLNLNHHGNSQHGAISATSDKSVASKNSRYSRTSNSSKSNTSELLTPSSHRFQKSLKSHRHINLPRFRRGNYFPRIKRKGSNSTNTSFGKNTSERTSTIGNYLNHLHTNGSPNQSDFSTCSVSLTTSSRCAPTTQSFLDENVQLQKDSGKGVEIGMKISATGRDEALQKLNDKMDVLAEVDRDGKWANATLTRIPAKDMTNERKNLGLEQQDFVETRSMLAVKLGFVSLKYGVLVHWNVHTGLAELILLRKSCPESFMKLSSGGKKKKTWKNKRKSFRAEEQDSFLATPGTVHSLLSDNSCTSLGLDPVASAHF